MEIGIVTDSLSSMPPEIAIDYNISIVPGTIHVGNEQYSAGVDISLEDIGKIIGKTRIKTSAPPPKEYYRTYKNLCEDNDLILSLHCPVKLSASLKAARTAAKRLNDPDKVKHIECGVASFGLGLIAIACATLARKQDMNADEIIKKANSYSNHSLLLGVINTFEYLSRSGRIGIKFAGLLANTLKIKPVLSLQNGEIRLLGRPRDREKATALLVESLYKSIERSMDPKIIGIGQFACLDEATRLEESLSKNLPNHDIIITEADPMVASYTGPGLMLVACFARINVFNGVKINV